MELFKIIPISNNYSQIKAILFYIIGLMYEELDQPSNFPPKRT